MANNVRSYSLGTYDEATRSIVVVASTRNPVKGWEPPKNPSDPMTPRLEALESWDLRRFAKNPVILWQHDGYCSAIGLASEVQETERGLEMRINFAAAKDEPRAEDAITRIKAGLVRGVSVGFDYGDRTDEVRDGRKVVVFRKNILSEASLVTIPADQDALAGDNPDDVLAEDEERRARASNAGRELAKHRQTRTDGADEVDRFDVGRLEKFERTQVGGLRIPARIARTGILIYRNPDGTERRELRLADECFKADSIASLNHAPVTDLEHHRSLISTHNWKDAALGHVDNVRADGDFIVGDILLNDASAIADVESGNLVECSAGYRCRLEWKSGTWKGERYDAIQRDIKYNHVAVLPPGRGRAGADVGLRLDSTDEDAPGVEEKEMSEKTLIRLDGKEFTYGSKEHIDHLDAKCAAAQADLAKVRTDLDALQGRFDAAESSAKKSKKDADEAAEKEKAERSKKAKAARLLRKNARKAIRALEDSMEEDDEEDEEDRTDKLDDELDEMSDRDVMVRVIRADAKEFDDKGRSDEYVQARFDVVLEQGLEKAKNEKVERHDSVDNTVRTIQRIRSDANGDGKDPESKAREAKRERDRNAWKRPIGGQSAT